jgi:acetyl-CoA carboxylase, biotin carboxylase subunit
LLDRNKNYYFLEMNTRLQVEHPVTELVTGINLVKEQIKIAYGQVLSYKQEDIKLNGHALECRIYAEDSFNGFLPDTGKISYYRQPAGYGVRVDSGVETGSEVTIHFDPMLAKLITFGRDRIEAINRMEMALRNYKIKGVRTIIPFLLAVMQHPEFRYGYFDTGFIEHSFDFESLDRMKNEHEEIVAAIATWGWKMSQNANRATDTQPKISKWKEKNLYMRRLV